MTKKEERKLAKRLLNKKDKEWREAVIKEFGKKCIVCQKTDKEVYRIHCHHLIPREIKVLRHVVINGITVCPKCHKYSNQISAHKNPIQFLLYYQNKYPKRYNQLLCLLE